MALYTNDSKERVRDAVDMVDLVSSRVELKRAGANRLTGLCPFHDERTPSFGINPAEKVYHCFGCQASGDAFTFVMETEGVDFKGALEHLADRYKVTLELEDEDPQAAEQRKRRERLLELLERTATFYVRQLWESDEAAKAREYLAGRGLQEATLREFRVGYAPSAWDTVLNASRRAGFGNRELYDAGLAQRVAVQRPHLRPLPLADHLPARRPARARARVRGAHDGRRQTTPPEVRQQPRERAVPQGQARCSPPTSRARPAAKAQSVVAAEGYTDVIAMHQAGVRNTVAIMGTVADGGAGRRARAARAGGQARARRRQRRARRRCCARRGSPPAASRRCACASSGCRRATTRRTSCSATGGEAIARLVDAVGAVRRASASCARLRDRRPGDAEGRTACSTSCATTSRCSRRAPSARSWRESPHRGSTSRPSCSSRCLPRAPARAPAPEADGRAARGRAAPPPQLGRRDPTERSFLALCIALPELGAPALAELDPEADLTSDVARRAAAHLRTHLRAPTDGLDDDVYDAELVALIRELAVRATAMTSASASRLRDRASAARARPARPRDRRGARPGRAIEELAARRGDAAHAPRPPHGAGLNEPQREPADPVAKSTNRIAVHGVVFTALSERKGPCC